MSETNSSDPKIITPPDTLSEKVTFGPGGVDVEKLERADAEVAELKTSYLDWVEGDLGKLQSLFNKAIACPESERAPLMRDLFLVAHDMKGQGGSFNYHLMTRIANLLCRYIEAQEKKPSVLFGPEEMEIVKLHVDALKLVINLRWEGEGGKEGKNLVAGLQAVAVKNIPGASND